jgi:uncharacterized protein (DUF983 family)
MGYIHVSSAAGAKMLTLRVSPDMWFYLAITLPLMVFTLLGWYWWEMRSRRKAKLVAADYVDVEMEAEKRPV